MKWLTITATLVGLSPLGAFAHHPPLLTIGLGFFNIVRQQNVYQFSVEYKFAQQFLKARPFLGSMVTTQGGSFLYAGIGWDIYLGRAVLTPSFAPGWWQSGAGKKLYFPLEFRSSLELAYLLPDQSRIGAQFYHISNASLGPKNPGEESLVFFYGLSL